MSDALNRLLAGRDWLLADGATGTNLFNMGLTAGEAPELWNVERPDNVRKLYQGAIDAGSGAMNKYPGAIEIVLVPERFTSTEERDTFFDDVRTRWQQQQQAQLAQVEHDCGQNEQLCNDMRTDVEKATQARLEKLEAQRAASIVVAAATDAAAEPLEIAPAP